MLTLVLAKQKYGQMTGNTQTTNLTFGGDLINQYINEYIHDYPNIMAQRTNNNLYTIPSKQEYLLPRKVQKVNTVTVTVNGFKWYPKEVKNMQQWNQINMVANITSDIPNYFFVYDQKLLLYPTPASGDNQITFRYQVESVPLYQPTTATTDNTVTVNSVPLTATLTGSVSTSATTATLTGAWGYDTGTYQITFSNSQTRLATLTNASTSVSWSTALTSTATTAITVRSSDGGDIVAVSASQYNTYLNNSALWALNIPQDASNRFGDSVWYLIDSVMTNGNAFTLKTRYDGQAISSATITGTIGEVPPLPETYHYLPVYKAVQEYFTSQSFDQGKIDEYGKKANELYAKMKNDGGEQTTDPTIEDGDLPIINPNLTISTGLS